jgi:hypothetical protein
MPSATRERSRISSGASVASQRIIFGCPAAIGTKRVSGSSIPMCGTMASLATTCAISV